MKFPGWKNYSFPENYLVHLRKQAFREKVGWQSKKSQQSHALPSMITGWEEQKAKATRYQKRRRTFPQGHKDLCQNCCNSKLRSWLEAKSFSLQRESRVVLSPPTFLFCIFYYFYFFFPILFDQVRVSCIYGVVLMCILIKSVFLQVKSLSVSVEFTANEWSLQIYLKALANSEYFQNVRVSLSELWVGFSARITVGCIDMCIYFYIIYIYIYNICRYKNVQINT